MDLGSGTGELALELAKRTKLQIYAIESDEKLVAAARRRIGKTGLYGTRIVVHRADPDSSHFPKQFANLVV
ncbi:MAG: class I SAM-dependent methyltransferase, partial [Planctomycetaceae bacterium]|nr:class I SAM-dependent methyltransferase [Planctomycetaceae bacterium]